MDRNEFDCNTAAAQHTFSCGLAYETYLQLYIWIVTSNHNPVYL